MYLKNWCTGDMINKYHLLVSNVKVPIWTKVSRKKEACLQNFYIRYGVDNKETDDLENLIDNMFENPAKKVIDNIIQRKNLCRDDWECFSRYIELQYVRTPSYYCEIVKTGQPVLLNALNDVSHELENLKDLLPVKTNKYSDLEFIPIKTSIVGKDYDEHQTLIKIDSILGKSIWLFVINAVIKKEFKIYRFFRDLKWSIVEATEGIEWPTSDNPVCIVHNTKELPPGYLKRDETMVILSITPVICVVGKTKNRLPYRFVADMNLSMAIKRIIIQNAFLYIYSKEVDQDIADIRPRCVNLKEFNRIKDEFANLHDMYVEDEVPMILR